jgi:hypothetical protein
MVTILPQIGDAGSGGVCKGVRHGGASRGNKAARHGVLPSLTSG